MYQKEIIYMGLYKDGSKMGSAGFLKVENRERESRLYLKAQNVPLGINGRFPIRIYNGNGWKEIKGISVQDGNGSWEEILTENVDKTVIQVILSGGYMLEGKSKYAPEMISQRNAEDEKEIRGYHDIIIPNNMDERKGTMIQDKTEEHGWTQAQRNADGRQSVSAAQGSMKDGNVTVQDDMEEDRNTEAQRNEAGRQTVKVMQESMEEYREAETQRSAVSRQGMQVMQDEAEEHRNTETQRSAVGRQGMQVMQDEAEEHREAETQRSAVSRQGMQAMQGEVEESRDTQTQRNAIGQRDIDVIKVSKKREEAAIQNHIDRKPVNRISGGNTDKDMRKAPQTIIITEELPRRTPGGTVVVPQSAPEYSLKEDKWEQILDTYERIHPYGDERVYVKLEPKDFVILQSKYQHLVNNSFLLHGFYNYRYIILGKEQDYYLGVPGVFYEREKMVAVMFGFEAFECPGGNVRAGEFGYYLRKVEL